MIVCVTVLGNKIADITGTVAVIMPGAGSGEGPLVNHKFVALTKGESIVIISLGPHGSSESYGDGAITIDATSGNRLIWEGLVR